MGAYHGGYQFKGTDIQNLVKAGTTANSYYTTITGRESAIVTSTDVYKNTVGLSYYDSNLNPSSLSDWYIPYTLEFTIGVSQPASIPSYFKHFNGILIGGGGGGAASGYSKTSAWSGGGGGGGGAGMALFYQNVPITSYPITYTVGTGGTGGTFTGVPQTNGNSTSLYINEYTIYANGGNAGGKGSDNNGGDDAGVANSGSGGFGWSYGSNTFTYIYPIAGVPAYLSSAPELNVINYRTQPYMVRDVSGTGNNGVSAGTAGSQTGTGGTINKTWIPGTVPTIANNYGGGGNGGAPVNNNYGISGNGGSGGYIAIYLFRQ